MLMTSPSMPVISEILMILRTPPLRRATWTTICMAEAIWRRMIQIGRSKPAMPTIISSRLTASRVSLAWIVVMLPSWPVFIAWSMSSVSEPRHSPMMIRSGRIRRALRTRSRVVTSPVPSMLAGRVSIRTTCGCWSRSSAASSIVATRSSSGMKAERAFSSVVLPLPVPPEMTMLIRALTQAERKSSISGVIAR